MLYPKINSLWKRQGWYFDEKEKKTALESSRQKFRQSFIIGDYACDEFGTVNRWIVDEKIDGTNIRIFWEPNKPFSPTFRGRTDNAQIPTPLLLHLQETFTREKLQKQFPEVNGVILFGEGYGNKIQAVGKRYRTDVSFILFDTWIDGWWLQKHSVSDIATNLGIVHTTMISSVMTTNQVIEFVKSKPYSYVANDMTLVMEGVIARSFPLMLFRNHHTPIMFKLKVRDFPELMEE